MTAATLTVILAVIPGPSSETVISKKIKKTGWRFRNDCREWFVFFNFFEMTVWECSFIKKIEILGENWNFGRKLKFWAKFEILEENWNFVWKLKFCVKIEILCENWNFGRKLKFWVKIEILDENWNYGRKLKLWTKIEISVENFGRKSSK